MTYQIKFRRDTAANFTSANPVLAEGEPGYETDSKRIKIGDGVNTWANLTYANVGIDSNITVTYGLTKVLNNIEVNNTEIQAQANIAIANSVTSLTANVDSVNGKTGVVTLTTTDIAEGSNLYYTNARVIAHIATVPLTVGGNLTVNGNLEVQGNIDYVNVQDLQVVDNQIILNFGNATAREAFIYVDRSGSALNNAYIRWNETNDLWEFNDGSNTYILPRSTTDLAEGANLYYTTDRANTAIGAYDGDINTTGNVTATNFTGNGAQLTNLVAANVTFEPNSLFANSIVNVQAALDDLQLSKLNVSALTSSVTFFATTANSNVVGYTNLVTTTADPDYNTVAVNVSTGAVTTSNQLLANLISAPGVLLGNTTPINITTIGNIRKTTGGTGQNARFYFEVYKRSAANAETLIGTSDLTPEITSATYEEFNDTALIVDTNFTANDSVVIKYYGTNVGGGSPTYDFQFGGTKPVRTLFPVPVSVVPVDKTAAGVEVDTANFAGVLSGSDDTAQKAFDTIDNITTTSVPEGTNLYYSNTRVNAFIQDNITTTDIDEGANLYYTTARANTAIAAYQGNINTPGNVTAAYLLGNGSQLTGFVSKTANVDSVNGATGVVVLDTDDIPEGSNLYYTNARVIAHIATVPLSVGGNLTVNGNLEVLGNIDYVNVQDLQVVDNQIILNYGNASAREAFIIVDRSGSALNNANIKWNEIDDRWEINDGGNTYILPRSTTDLTEGANLYYTTDRANTAIGAYQGNINTVGNVTAAYLLGNGSQLTGFVSKTANVDSVNGLTGAVSLSNANVALKVFSETPVDLGNVSGDISGNIDLSLGSIFTMTATGNITANSMANATPGVSATLIITQDGTGDRLLDSTWKFAGNVNTLSNTANTTDIISVIFAGNVYYAAITKGFE